MKKIHLIAAAIAILTSCSSESIFNEIKDESPRTPITFSSYSEKSTKADTGDNTSMNNLEFFHSTFSVYGTKKDLDNEIQYVFGDTALKIGTTCTYTGNGDGTFHGSNWSYGEERFWDKWSTYNFIAYAPADHEKNPLSFTYGTAQEVGPLGGEEGRDILAPDYYLIGTNLQQAGPSLAPKEKGFNVFGQDLDLMTCNPYPTRNGKDQSTVDFTFHHILAKLNVSITKTADMNEGTVIIDSIIITGLKDMGSYAESKYGNPATELSSGWTLANTNHNAKYELAYRVAEGHPELPDIEGTTPKPLYYIESMVMPQTVANDAKLSLRYNISKGNYKEYYKYDIDLKDLFTTFLGRSYYTIKFTLNSDVISFDVAAYSWASNESSFQVSPVPASEP